jgi:hypothetical protein
LRVSILYEQAASFACWARRSPLKSSSRIGPVSAGLEHCSLKFMFRLNANLFHNFYCPGKFFVQSFWLTIQSERHPGFFISVKNRGYQDLIIKTTDGVLLNFPANNALVMLQKSQGILLNVKSSRHGEMCLRICFKIWNKHKILSDISLVCLIWLSFLNNSCRRVVRRTRILRGPGVGIGLLPGIFRKIFP